MLEVKQKLGLVILFLLVALVVTNWTLFSLWKTAENNVEVVKLNAVNELVECGCEGYWRGVPYVYHQRDLNVLDLNTGGFVKAFK